MMVEQQDTTQKKGVAEHSIYNPIHVTDTVGVIILGVLSFIMLVALLRSQARNRELLIHVAGESDA
jgi:hypothetical protein